MEKLIGYEEEIRQSNILSVQINLLNKCTSKCRSCRKYTWPNDTLSIEDIKNTLSVLSTEFGLKTVVLSGGDPICYDGFTDVVKYANDIGLKCSMITTGITKDKSILDTMCNGMYRIHLSLDSCDAEQYKYIRGVDAFDIVDNNIKEISKVRKENGLLPIRLSSTISKMNCTQVMTLYEYAKENGCLINFYLVHTFDNLSMTDYEIDAFYNMLKCIMLDEKQNGVISNAMGLLSDRYVYGDALKCRCYVPSISCVINANGDIYPCCRVFKDNGFYGEQVELAYGNIINKNREELIEEFDKRFASQYPLSNNEECRQCGQRYFDMLKHLEKVKQNRKDVLFI